MLGIGDAATEQLKCFVQINYEQGADCRYAEMTLFEPDDLESVSKEKQRRELAVMSFLDEQAFLFVLGKML